MERPGKRIGIAAAGLAAGLIVAFLLPASWIFLDAGAGDAEDGGTTQYACVMFCVVMDEMPPSGKCPVCGMELAEVSSESSLNPAEREMAGIVAGRLERAPLAVTVRAAGEVDYDESRLSRITTRTAGWMTEVRVEAAFAEVEEGEALGAIYSPELYAAQEEFLVARRAGEEALLAAATRRLALLGIGPAEVAEIARTGRARESLLLRSPRSGVVVERRAVEGSAVKRGETLFTVADLSRVWVQAEVFESDLRRLRPGQAVRLDAESLEEPLPGRVAFVDPVIDRRTRTARVRIEVENPRRPDGARRLRIGQRVDARIEARLDAAGRLVPPGENPGVDPLVLPRSAVLKTGERVIVYALHTRGAGDEPDYRLDPANLPDTVLYEMVEVRVGPLARRVGDGPGDELYPVLDAGGLPEGAVIVTHGNLLLDSQAQLSGKPSLLFPEGSRGGSSDPHAGH